MLLPEYAFSRTSSSKVTMKLLVVVDKLLTNRCLWRRIQCMAMSHKSGWAEVSFSWVVWVCRLA